MKLQKLRDTLLAAVPGMESDQLFVRLTNGSVTDTGAGMRYDAQCSVIVLEWPVEAHPIVLALHQWLRDYESVAKDALQFEVDALDHTLVDLHFTLPYTEVVVADADASVFAACDKPLPDPADWLPGAPHKSPA